VLFVLRPLTPERMRDVILGPAQVTGTRFESEEMVEELVTATAAAEGSLPLLQFALAELWEGRDTATNTITRAALESVGLLERAGHLPNELSGGQQQRVAVARALVTDPAILLADEPTGNLDSESSLEIMKLLRDLNQQGRTIVLITHEADIAAFASRVVRLRDGVIISDESRPTAMDIEGVAGFSPRVQ